MGSFVTGVAIVTTTVDGEPHGMTVNSLTSVSLKPLLLLVCLTIGTRTANAVDRSGSFAINLLSQHQHDIADMFARPGGDHFGGCRYKPDPDGLPLIEEGVGHVACRVVEAFPGGDHTIFIGKPLRAAFSYQHPLVFHRGRYDELTGRGRAAARDWYW